jgi:fatty acid desaturase
MSGSERLAPSTSPRVDRRPDEAPRWVSEARDLAKDLFPPKPSVYWTDFLVTWTIGVLAFDAIASCTWSAAVCARVDGGGYRWGVAALLFSVSCMALYRAALFIHELAHLSAGSFAPFRLVWNLLCGIPFLMPSFVYSAHHVHHRATEYGSAGDGEYVPWARRPRLAIVLYLAHGVFVPGAAVIRFLVLAPLSRLSPRVAVVVQRRASSLVVNPAFCRALPTPEELRGWRRLETGCFAVILAVAGLAVSGLLPPAWLLQAYLTAVVVVTLNALRTLAAHRYRHGDGGVSPVEQMLDSVTHPRAPLLAELWAPLGLRFHALHHLLPSLPYHALPAAHRRLLAALPADCPYRRTESAGLWCSLRRLWREAGARSL